LKGTRYNNFVSVKYHKADKYKSQRLSAYKEVVRHLFRKRYVIHNKKMETEKTVRRTSIYIRPAKTTYSPAIARKSNFSPA